MTPHSNRHKNKAAAGREPRPEELRKYREAAGLTQEQAATLIYTSPRNWQNWEQGHGDRRMPASAFELFMLKTGQYSRLHALGPENERDVLELANGARIEVLSPRD